MGQHGKQRKLVRIAGLFYLLFATALQADCRQALALGLDVSGSVDDREYRLQLDGLAAALQDVKVRAALMAMPSAPVALAVYEWSGPQDQHLVIDWTLIEKQTSLDQLTARLFATKRMKATPSTAIGSSMVFGAALLGQQPDCWRRTLDLSGDGPSNSGPRPRDVKGSALMSQITINGLVVGVGDIKSAAHKANPLKKYYESEVIHGPASFAEEAAGFDQFQATMTRKLLRELQAVAVSQLLPAK